MLLEPFTLLRKEILSILVPASSSQLDTLKNDGQINVAFISLRKYLFAFSLLGYRVSFVVHIYHRDIIEMIFILPNDPSYFFKISPLLRFFSYRGGRYFWQRRTQL